MPDIFRIDVLPAQRGDALWIEYGPATKPRRVLIDAGIKRTGREHVRERLAKLDPASANIELFIVSHIDADHIEGALEVLKDPPAGVTWDRIWFNGLDQLPPDPLQPHGVAQGMALMDLLHEGHRAAWNREVEGAAICVSDDGAVREFKLPGGMTVTVLSPDRQKLEKLRKEWDKVLEEFGAEPMEEPAADDVPLGIPGLETLGADEIDVDALADTEFKEDNGAPNGSSIAVLLRYRGKSALLLADAHPGLIMKALKQLSPDEPLRADCVKVSHHGSKKNTSRELAEYLVCPHWVFSSNGAQFKHPDQAAIARVLRHSPGEKTLYFNYRSEFNQVWDDAGLQETWNYQAVFGKDDRGISVKLL